jgi:hypothetical protein
LDLYTRLVSRNRRKISGFFFMAAATTTTQGDIDRIVAYYGSLDAIDGAHCPEASGAEVDDVALAKPRAGTCCGSSMHACSGDDLFMWVLVISFVAAFFVLFIGCVLGHLSDLKEYNLTNACMQKCAALCYGNKQRHCVTAVYEACMGACDRPPRSYARMHVASLTLLIMAAVICALDAVGLCVACARGAEHQKAHQESHT